MTSKIFIHSFSDFLEIQRLSFLWFLIYGLKEPLNKLPLFVYVQTEKYLLNPQKYYIKLPIYTPTACKLDDLTYCLDVFLLIKNLPQANPLNLNETLDLSIFKESYLLSKKAQITLKNRFLFIKNLEQNKKRNKQFKKVCIGEIPLMSDDASFVINGTERAVISQMTRSSGVSYQRSLEKSGSLCFSASIISETKAWFKIDFLESFYDDPIENIGEEDLQFKITLDKGQTFPLAFLLIAFGLNSSILSGMSRYPDYISQIMLNYEEFYGKQKVITLMCQSLLEEEIIENVDIDSIFLNNFFYQSKYFFIGKTGRHRLNQNFNINLAPHIEYLTPLDLVCVIDGLIALQDYVESVDEIDNLSNKRIRPSGQIVKDLFKAGVNRLARHIDEMSYNKPTRDTELFDVFDPRFVSASFREFFATSELSQFLDNINPLADLAHKRRITVLGLDGISAENASFEIRDIHSTHYGRLCPIETPEGQNAGLVTTLALCSQLNSFGFLETPYFFCKKGKAYINQKPRYVDSKLESNMIICSSDVKIDKSFHLGASELPVRVNNNFYLLDSNLVDFLSITALQLFSIATSLVPFFEHNDANRVLMGANMQRQAVPLLYPQKPIVGTGMEFLIAFNSGLSIKSYSEGFVTYSSSERIVIGDDLDQTITYPMKKYLRTNSDTCMNQKPLVWIGEHVFAGQVLADGPATLGAELALGRNLLLAYMPWEGYNFEDAVIISEEVVKKDLLTSIHIEEYQTEIADTVLGPEKITNNIHSIKAKNIKNLGSNGLILEGTFVRPGDVLVGKLTPLDEEKSPEARILKGVFGKKYICRYKENSLLLPDGCQGRVIDVRMITKTHLTEDDDGSSIIAVVRIYIAQTRKIVIGDKIAGRHGNKGVISKILSVQDMPYLPDGTPVDIIFNPLGVPSRMNVGQLFECLLGFAGEKLNRRFKVVPFDETFGLEASRILTTQKLKQAAYESNLDWMLDSNSPGKLLLRDGRTGEFFDNPIFLGKTYILKLMHLVEDKIHARATGPYSLITQQPLGGRAQNGGQRFGEMEVWALQAYGAAYSLQELLTIRSDDIDGRNNTFDAMIHGRMPAKPQVPESFNVLTRELRALGLDLLTHKLKLNPFKSFSDEFFNEVDMLRVFEIKLRLQNKSTQLNPRTRILSYLHNEDLYNQLIYPVYN